ncbi:MAG: three-Cys-motif partner protein TcmP [Chthoniobacteraceae bacterium]
MPREEIESQPFAEGTLTKLDLFQLYTRAWLPVFTAPPEPIWKRLHIFDFFCGAGEDCTGQPGSPLRILTELRECWPQVRSKGIHVSVSFSDNDAEKVRRLKSIAAERRLAEALPGLALDCTPGDFQSRFNANLSVLRDSDTACLVILDQYGFKEVDADIFRTLTGCPTTDFLFFISTQHLHRFADHPIVVRQYEELERARDYYHAHRKIYDWYRERVPAGREYYLAPFSFLKGSNVYAVIFGSGHPRGMEQFLSVAWQKDKLNGEADYDLNREEFRDEAPYLALDMFEKPMKTKIFEVKLRRAILAGLLSDERGLYLFCLENGMLPKHARSVLSELKHEGRIELGFQVPSRESLKQCRPFKLLR